MKKNNIKIKQSALFAVIIFATASETMWGDATPAEQAAQQNTGAAALASAVRAATKSNLTNNPGAEPTLNPGAEPTLNDEKFTLKPDAIRNINPTYDGKNYIVWLQVDPETAGKTEMASKISNLKIPNEIDPTVSHTSISHSSRWIPASHFRMGLLSGLTPVFCSSQPHRPTFARSAGYRRASADEDRLHRGLHVVVDAARAGPFEKSKRAVMRVEHHLLRLARIGADEQHPAVAQPDVRHLHRHRRAVDQHDFMAGAKITPSGGLKPSC